MSKKNDRISNLMVLVFIILLLSVSFDFLTTYLLFKKDYDKTMENEINMEIRKQVELYGAIGAIMPTINQVMLWFLMAFIGSFIITCFFFDDFKTKYGKLDRITIAVCLSFLTISTLHIGAGVLNLLPLLFDRWYVI